MIKMSCQRRYRLFRAASCFWFVVMIGLGLYNHNALVNQNRLQFDLMALLPDGTESTDNHKLKAVNHLMADSKLTSQVIILVGAHDGIKAKSALTMLRQKIQRSSLPLKEQSATAMGEAYKSLIKTLHKHRQGLLSQQDLVLLRQGEADSLKQRFLSALVNPFSPLGPAQLKQDPFFLFFNYVAATQPENSFQPDETGDLFLTAEGKTWYLYKAHLTQEAFSLQVQEKIAQDLSPILETLEQNEGVETLKLGAVFYAEAGAKQAQGEISSIGFLSFIGIILMIFLTFRTFRPLFFATIVIGSGIIGGLSACLFLFGSIHILAFVFGCSLVGITVDYALHYFCASYTGNPEDKSPFSILTSLMPALPMGVLSSCLGYGLLIFVPFPGIQQMATLACFGLLFAFLSVCLWGPYFNTKSSTVPFVALRIQQSLENLALLGQSKKVKSFLCFCALTLSTIGSYWLTVDDDIRSLQSPNKALKVQEEKIKSLTKWDTSTKFMEVTAASFEEILVKQEALKKDLETLKSRGILSDYQSLATLIPSIKHQQENYHLVDKLMENHGKVLTDTWSIPPYKKDVPFTPFVLTRENVSMIPEGWRELIHLHENTLSVRILIKGVPETNEASSLLQNLSQAHSNQTVTVHYIDSLKEYKSLFQSYRLVIVLLILSILLGIVLFISFIKNFLGALQVITPVILSLITTIGLLEICQIPLNLFHIMGFLLVLCIGIDYGLFLFWQSDSTENKKGEKEDLILLANALAAMTTLLSFGLLALSETTAVRSFGLSVFLGITCSFLLTTLFLGKAKNAL